MKFGRFRSRTKSEAAGSCVAARVSAYLSESTTLPDEVAYRLIEEARLRCGRRRDEASDGADRDRWVNLHRELGIAGYLTSAEIPSCKRRSLLNQARERSLDDADEPAGAEHAILRLITTAAAAAVDALLVPVLAEHVQVATEHLGQARQILVRTLSEQRTQSPTMAHSVSLRPPSV